MSKLLSFIGVMDDENDEHEDESVETKKDTRNTTKAPSSMRGSNVVTLHNHKNLRLVLFEPQRFEDAQEIADNLKGHRPVLINLQRISREQGGKIIDFLSGTIYALGGHIQKVGPHIFICAPANVDIQGSISEIFHQKKREVEI